jgi:hypothetical protein
MVLAVHVGQVNRGTEEENRDLKKFLIFTGLSLSSVGTTSWVATGGGAL